MTPDEAVLAEVRELAAKAVAEGIVGTPIETMVAVSGHPRDLLAASEVAAFGAELKRLRKEQAVKAGMFECTRLHCRLTVRACCERQAIARDGDSCHDCQDGKKRQADSGIVVPARLTRFAAAGVRGGSMRRGKHGHHHRGESPWSPMWTGGNGDDVG